MTLQVQNEADTCGQGRGRLIVTPVNGVPPYSYDWLQFSGLNNDTVSALHSGWYTWYVTDTASCVRKAVVYVSNYSPFLRSQHKKCFLCFLVGCRPVNNGIPFVWPRRRGRARDYSGMVYPSPIVVVVFASSRFLFSDSIRPAR
ncbi:MAG: hypothetical protein IPP38_01990 [Bacteroidetes bacterium]|nr:hypothetical protein [Bacteroidota bacterium]